MFLRQNLRASASTLIPMTIFDNRDHIHNASFSMKFMNWPHKLECYNTLGSNAFLGTNVLDYKTHL